MTDGVVMDRMRTMHASPCVALGSRPAACFDAVYKKKKKLFRVLGGFQQTLIREKAYRKIRVPTQQCGSTD